jgi:hypothetical protein
MFNNAPIAMKYRLYCTFFLVPLAAMLILAMEQSAAAQTSDENAVEQPIYKYTGNSFSLKFHRPSCKFARAMWRGHVVRFQYRKQAIDAGQKPCRYCLPPDWKTVGAKVLGTGVPTDAQNVSSPDVPSAAQPVPAPGETSNTAPANPTTTVPQLNNQNLKTQSIQTQTNDGMKAEALRLETHDYRLPTSENPDFPFASSKNASELQIMTGPASPKGEDDESNLEPDPAAEK